MGLLSIRVLCNGVMALSVGSFAGWLYCAHPSDVSRLATRVMDVAGPIVTPRMKEPPAEVARQTTPSSQAPPDAAPPAKTATPTPAAQPAKPVAKPTRKAVAKAASTPKREASKPLVKSSKPQIASAAKSKRATAVDD
jgi:hypothetical protein